MYSNKSISYTIYKYDDISYYRNYILVRQKQNYNFAIAMSAVRYMLLLHACILHSLHTNNAINKMQFSLYILSAVDVVYCCVSPHGSINIMENHTDSFSSTYSYSSCMNLGSFFFFLFALLLDFFSSFYTYESIYVYFDMQEQPSPACNECTFA